MAEGMSKAHQRQQSKHKRNGKYVIQKERTFKNKLWKQLLNACKNDKRVLTGFISSHGGKKTIEFSAQNELNRQQFIHNLQKAVE